MGAGEIGKCSKVVTQGIVITVMCSPALVVITYFVSGIFENVGHDPVQVELEKTYYVILMLGVVVTLTKTCLSSYFAGIGRTRVVMICDVCGLVFNVPLCYVMVFGKLGLPALGIIGAGVSTIIASVLACLLFILFYMEREHRVKFSVMNSFHVDWGVLRRFWRLGFPSGLELFLNVAAFNLFLLMFQGYGVVEGASAAIVFNWDLLSFVPMIGLNIGVISLIGRFVGANDMARTDEVMSAAFFLGIFYSAILAILYISFRFPLVEVFSPPEGNFSEIRDLAAFMMIGLSSYVMADAIIIISGGVLRGAGDTRWLMYTSVGLHWAMLIAQYYVILVWQFGPRVSWLTFCAMIFAIAIVYVWRLQSGVWRDPERLKLVMNE